MKENDEKTIAEFDNTRYRCPCGWEGLGCEMIETHDEHICPKCPRPFDELTEVPLCVACEDTYVHEEGDKCGVCVAAEAEIVNAGCPRCGGDLRLELCTNSLSRRDGRTYICPRCGDNEAMEDAGYNQAYDGPPYWDVKIAEAQQRRTPQIESETREGVFVPPLEQDQ